MRVTPGFGQGQVQEMHEWLFLDGPNQGSKRYFPTHQLKASVGEVDYYPLAAADHGRQVFYVLATVGGKTPDLTPAMLTATIHSHDLAPIVQR